MNENSRRVLEMLSEGKVSVNEAERLLSLVDEEPKVTTAMQPLAPLSAGSARRYLRVTINSDDDEHIDVRVPLALIKAGVKLHTLLPEKATKKIKKIDEEKRHRCRYSQPASRGSRSANRRSKRDRGQYPRRGRKGPRLLRIIQH